MPIVAMPDGAQVQFPDDMPPDQIKSLILQKFPDAEQKAQNESDSAMLAAQFGGVTPEQGTRVVNSVGRMAANVPESAVNTTVGVAQPFIHPIDTAEGIGNLGKGILQKFGVVSGNDSEKYADAVGKAFLDRYGSVDNVAKTLETDPVGALMDLSTILSGGGAASARLPSVAGEVGNVVRTVGNVTNPLTAVAETANAGGRLVSRAVGNPMAPGVAADADLNRALARDNMTRQDINSAIVASPRANATVADVGGENVRGLVERVAQTPGAGRSDVVPFLTDRQNRQLTRVTSDLKTLTGTTKTAVQSIGDQISARTQNAAPLYRAAYEEGDRAIWNPELERLSATPEVQTAMREAISGWQRSQIANGYGAANPGAMVGNGGILKMLGGRVPAFPNLQFWDYTKGALDDMIAASITPEGTMTRKGRDLTIIANKLRGTLDNEVPTYANARQAWAGPSAYITAINEGKNFQKVSAEEVSAKLRGFDSDAQREAYRIGALSSLFVKAGSRPNELTDITQFLRSPEMRGKISAMMPTQEAAAKWDRILSFETKSSQLVGKSLAGSPTARRLAEMADSNSVGQDLILDAFMGHPPLGIFRRLIGNTLGKIRDTARSSTDAELSKRLLGSQLPELSFAPQGRLPLARNIGLGAFQLGRGLTQ